MASRKVRRGPMTAAEFVEQLAGDPEYQRQKAKIEAARRAADEAHRVAEAPIVLDLKSAGFDVQSVWDFVNTTELYTSALPILLDHLQRPYPPKVREGIARAMAVPESKFAWDKLVSLFRREFDRKANGVKWAIGCALAAAADDEVMPDVIALFRDSRHGENRIAFVRPLARSHLANARAALEAARQDPEVAREVSRVIDGTNRRRRNRRSDSEP
jgi:hypothetical protein